MTRANSLMLGVILMFYINCNPEDYSAGSYYLNDPTISTPSGILLDSSESFLPQRYYRDTSSTDSAFNLFDRMWFSANYRCFKAPILYNYYQGYENYRFLWIRSFHRPVLITIEKKTRSKSIQEYLKSILTFSPRFICHQKTEAYIQISFIPIWMLHMSVNNTQMPIPL